jgi:hypothetical protein
MGSKCDLKVRCGLEIRYASDEEEKGPKRVAYLVKLRGRGREGARNPYLGCSFTNGPFSTSAGMGWSVRGTRHNGKKAGGLL